MFTNQSQILEVKSIFKILFWVLGYQGVVSLRRFIEPYSYNTCTILCIFLHFKKTFKNTRFFFFIIGMSHVCTRDKIQKVERGGNSSSFFPSCSSTFQFLSLATAAAVGSFVLPKRLFDARPSTCVYVGACIHVIPSFRLNFSILYVVPHPTFSQSIEIKHSCGHTEFTHSYSHLVYCCRNIP